ncbi:MAG: pilus assembly protein PilM [Syntrophomonadaceae bacterium]|nr:pilus assembly protein PilM [Syntrophomonadaceae bacterium]
MQQGKKIFALDIGTRKIVGLVMEKTTDGYAVLGSEMIEHKTRAMLDGQIHDVEAIARTIKTIKNSLEKQLHMKLEMAAVAAAGRALKTSEGMVKKRRNSLVEIETQEIRALEIEAVQDAQFKLASEEKHINDKNHYICAGYSVVYYALEGQKMSNLTGHVGMDAEVKILATFLPRVVVDSLFSALKKSGLKVYSMTLEPIAAISVAIPDTMRLLNLVLVDIGAGTSDIAIVKENNVFAYAMVPCGGDKLTEAISARYLLDFNQAEQVKKNASGLNEVQATDILGNKLKIKTEELKEVLKPDLIALINNVAEQILNLNKKAPDAVICVGGGSLTPDLTKILADKLQLGANRVGTKEADSLNGIKFSADYLSGPQGITPLGIAYNSFTVPPLPFIRVSVNKREITLWNAGTLNVGLALLNSGIALSSLYGKPGLGKTFTLNGQIKVFKGGLGEAPVIKVNNKKADLETIVKDKDKIEFIQGQNGNEPLVKLSDFLNFDKRYVYVNGEKTELKPVIYINDQEYRGPLDTIIEDRAKISFRDIDSVANVLALANVPDAMLKQQNYQYTLEGQSFTLEWRPVKVLVNGREAELNQSVEAGAQVEYFVGQHAPRIKDILKDYAGKDFFVLVNGEEVAVKAPRGQIRMNDKAVTEEDELLPGAAIKVEHSEKEAILSDIFQNLHLAPNLKGIIKIRVNGQEAGFTTPINNNSKIELTWDSLVKE